MKFSTNKVGSIAKGVGSKDGFKTILWLMAIIAVLFFGKKLFSLVQGIFNFGKTESAENIAIIEAGKTEFNNWSKTFPFKNAGVPLTTIDTEVQKAIQYMSGYTTDWTDLNTMIVKMTPAHFVAFFIKFGVRINDEFQNQAGDFVDWLNFEKRNSPIAYITNPTSAIKDYLNKLVIPYVTKYNGMQLRLKKIND